MVTTVMLYGCKTRAVGRIPCPAFNLVIKKEEKKSGEYDSDDEE